MAAGPVRVKIGGPVVLGVVGVDVEVVVGDGVNVEDNVLDGVGVDVVVSLFVGVGVGVYDSVVENEIGRAHV